MPLCFVTRSLSFVETDCKSTEEKSKAVITNRKRNGS